MPAQTRMLLLFGTKVKDLLHMLSMFVRLQIAEEDAARLRRQLDKRQEQLSKMVKAFQSLKDKEASLSTALETANLTTTQLQRDCSESQIEAARCRESTAILRKRHEELTAELETFKLTAAHLAEKHAADQELVTVARTSAEQIAALNRALTLASEENQRLNDVVANAKAEFRRETVGLQRLADERQQMIVMLQADLSAASSALSLSAGSGPLQDAPSSHDADDGGSGMAGAGVGGRSAARRRGLQVGTTGGKPIVALKGLKRQGLSDNPDETSLTVDASAHGDGRVLKTSAAKLQLEVESLMRRLQMKDDQIQSLQLEQDQLLVANERLLHTIDTLRAGAAAAGGDVATDDHDRAPSESSRFAGAPMSAGHAAGMSELAVDVLNAEEAFRSVALLLASVQALCANISARLQAPEDLEDDDTEIDKEFNRAVVSGGFKHVNTLSGSSLSLPDAESGQSQWTTGLSRQFMLVKSLPARLRFGTSILPPRLSDPSQRWTDPRDLKQVVDTLNSTVGSLRLEVMAAAAAGANADGSPGCNMQ
jgi:hypothetical protein